MHRRQFLQSTVAGCIWLNCLPFSVRAAEATLAPKKLIWVMLRGAMDGMHAVVPIGDAHLMQHRAALVTPIKDKLLPLDPHFALHPSLVSMHSLYRQGHLIPIVAVASGYRERSHFDAQDQMESGLDQTDYDSGWLARTLQQTHGEGLVIARSIPIALRGADNSQSWYPSQLRPADEDLIDRLANLYEGNAQYAQWLNQAIESRDLMGKKEAKGRPSPKFDYLAERCARIMSANPMANCAMLEMGGWDTHNGQVNRLARQFAELDAGISNLQTHLGDAWNDTVVIVSTEFGRTVAINGTSGTDHGTASSLFVAGGRVKGGKVLGDWPGLAPQNLYENRDLKPTSDVRTWMGAILNQHLGLSMRQTSKVFPDLKSFSKIQIV